MANIFSPGDEVVVVVAYQSRYKGLGGTVLRETDTYVYVQPNEYSIRATYASSTEWRFAKSRYTLELVNNSSHIPEDWS